MNDLSPAVSYAIQITRVRGLSEIGPDELLLGCLRSIARFGIARFGKWQFDLEAFGVNWLEEPPRAGAPKVAYSDSTVAAFDQAARIARADGCTEIRLEHMLVAFVDETEGVMGELKARFAIDSGAWRAAAASLAAAPPPEPAAVNAPRSADTREYLTPEEAAETLGIHVQTLRLYVRSGKLPALRIAGERSLRIRRADLDKVLEPLVPEKQ